MSKEKANKLDELVRETEEQERNDIEMNETHIPDMDLFSPSTVELIKQAKQSNQSAFQSYWEADENDISGWTESQISQDPGKQLVTYAENGQLAEIKRLITDLNDPKTVESMLTFKDSDGYTAMHRAAYSNMLDVVKYLVSFEASLASNGASQLNARTEMGWTPLHSAVYWNSYAVVEYLLKHARANPNIKSNSGQTCLHLAAQQANSRESLLLLLFSPFVNFNLRNDQNESARDIALRCSKYNVLFEITEENLNRL